VPSLLSLPYLGWCDKSDPLYRATRARILSSSNPYFFTGAVAAGIGSPHTGVNRIWRVIGCVQCSQRAADNGDWRVQADVADHACPHQR
jgi:meiotically up-regulated gene 157 (Mug157) protein